MFTYLLCRPIGGGDTEGGRGGGEAVPGSSSVFPCNYVISCRNHAMHSLAMHLTPCKLFFRTYHTTDVLSQNNPPLWSSSESTLQYVLFFRGTAGKTLSYQEKSPSRRSSKNPLGRHATRFVTSSLWTAPLASELPITRSSGRKHTTRGVFPLSSTKTTGRNYYLPIRYRIASL